MRAKPVHQSQSAKNVRIRRPDRHCYNNKRQRCASAVCVAQAGDHANSICELICTIMSFNVAASPTCLQLRLPWLCELTLTKVQGADVALMR